MRFFVLFLSVVIGAAALKLKRNASGQKPRDLIRSTEKFPSSENPISGQPPLIRPTTPSCSVTLLQNVSLYFYDEIVSNHFQLPSGCRSPWNKIILDVSAFEQGTQYDRFGGLWINEIEILRTTTPEPTASGINWSIEKDITIYGEYLLSKASNLTAFVSIPNNVDSTYTGIIYLTATLTFYNSSDEFPPEKNLPQVIPLTRAPQNSLFDSMQVSSTQSLTYPLQLPTPTDAVSLLVDIYASGHGCEEFYYSNLPSQNASQYGFCGGGIYREIQVFIDEIIFAGSVLPFPVIYTGGINPFLWRPLTGMMSFDVPSHRLDLSPFLSYLANHQKNHTITFKVFNNNDNGFWYLDASLLLIHGEDPTFQLVGSENSVSVMDTRVKLNEKPIFSPSPSPEISFHTLASHYYHIEGQLSYSNGMKVTRQVSGRQLTINTNTLLNEGSTTRTIQNSTCITESKTIFYNGDIYEETTASHYPLYVEDYYGEDETTMDLAAVVAQGYNRVRQWSFQPAGNNTTRDDYPKKNIKEHREAFFYEVSWSNQMFSNASYNRSLDHNTVFVQEDHSLENYRIWSTDLSSSLSSLPTEKKPVVPLLVASLPKDYREFVKKLSEVSLSSSDGLQTATQDACFLRDLEADNGYVLHQSMNGSCSLPLGMTFCGYDVCGMYDVLPLQQISEQGKKVEMPSPSLQRFPVIDDDRRPFSHSSEKEKLVFQDENGSLEKTTRRRRQRN
jgi:hypothetical protein